MQETSAIRILIAEDHVVVREGLAAIIDYQPDMCVAGHASNGKEAIARFSELRPDVTLMDLRMPEVGGVEAIAAIRNEFEDARIIVLTTYDGDEDIFRALEAGAQGYLLKDTPKEDLLEAIRAVNSGQRRIPAEVAARLAERVMAGRSLSPREVEVLWMIAEGKSNKEIGNALFIAEGTVKAHINNIHEKLGVGDRTQAVTVAIRRGIIHI
jgi:two-component system NarL family response regulator